MPPKSSKVPPPPAATDPVAAAIEKLAKQVGRLADAVTNHGERFTESVDGLADDIAVNHKATRETFAPLAAKFIDAMTPLFTAPVPTVEPNAPANNQPTAEAATKAE